MTRASSFLVLAATVLASLSACRTPSSSSEPTRPVAAAPVAPPKKNAAVRPLAPPSGRSLALAEIDGRRAAIVADEDEHALAIVDLATRAVLATRWLEGTPGQLLLAPDGRLFVALRDRARLLAFAVREDLELAEVARQDTGDEPWGLALGHDRATVLVTTIASARLEAFSAADLAPRFVTPLRRDPRSVLVTAEGSHAFVSHATGSVVSAVGLTGGAASPIALDARERRRDFDLEHATKPPAWPMKSMRPARVRITMKRTATQGFALASIGSTLYLPESLVMTADNEQIPTGYGSVEQSTLGTHVPFVAQVDLASRALVNGAFSGPDDRACFEKRTRCILPRDATTDGKSLFVACLDSDEIEVVDPTADADHAPSCTKVLATRTRIHVEKPSSVAVDPERRTVVAFSAMTRVLTVAPLDGGAEPTTIALSPRHEEPPPAVALGRRLFHTSGDRRIASDGRACASCHVDGREDALVWPTPKGKRQTPMLAGRIDGTAPYGWNGEHATLASHIASTLKNLGGKGLAPEEIAALGAYVASMKAPSRRVATAATVARGKAVFESSETGCASCHDARARFTDNEAHALGKSKTAFATPSLAFVGQTAPYFHDGRYATLEELIEKCDGEMGTTKHLSEADRTALVDFLRTL